MLNLVNSSLFEATQVGTKGEIQPIEESPVIACRLVIEFPVPKPGGAIANKVARDQARLHETANRLLRPEGLW